MATCGEGRQTPETKRARAASMMVFAIGIGALSFSAPVMAQQGSVWINPDIVGDTSVSQLQPGLVSPGPQRYRLPFNKPSGPVRLTPPGARNSNSNSSSVGATAGRAPVLSPPAAPRAPVTVARQPAAAAPAPATSPERTVARQVEPPAAVTPVPTPPPVATTTSEPEPARTEPRVIRPTAPATVEAPAAAPTPPSAEPAAPPRQVATAAPAATASAAAGATRVLFQGASEDLDPAGRAAIRDVAASLKDTSDRIQIRAYADSETETEGWKRRLSLRRGNNVRLALLDEGVQSFRILLRALGAPTDGGPGNRVDLITESR
ncbi:OmpA family protein [Minwuia sp. IMCC3060]|uniref:OmpA family protein n=1 Tax=Minwuia sp. IMCC3060 TaxID=3040675 RepID=UPI0024790777|nr:OmpA family protein [Minwuia sp. IMCC3060]